jgi:C-terminal peptidase prc
MSGGATRQACSQCQALCLLLIVDQPYQKYKIWQPLLLAISAALGLWAGLNMRQVEPQGSVNTETNKLYLDRSQKIKDVISFVQSKYVDSIDQDLAIDFALESFMSNLDPYSEYIPAKFIHSYADQINGKSRGMGIRIVAVDSQLMVSQVIKNSPAANAGIKIGDKILEIENLQAGMVYNNLDSVRLEIQNHINDSIRIKWESNLSKVTLMKQIALTELDDHAVTNVHTPVKQILYLKLNQLSKDSYRDFMNAVEKNFDRGQCKHLIIDLRNNSGGLVHEAASILNQLISEKDVLLFKTSGNKVKEKEFKSTGKPFFRIDKIAVIVNNETASAAEIMAAALQDLDRAIIIGSPTFGKSVILEQYSLGDGSAIRLSVSRYTTYSGRSIQKNYENPENIPFLGQSIWLQDSGYYSLKNKKLVSHQGVVPDILISDNNSYAQENSLFEFADVIVGRHFMEFKKLINENPDKINTDKKVSELIRTAILKEHPAATQIELTKMESECRYALARWFFGDEFEERMRLMNDECLAAAVGEIGKG